MPGPKSDKKMDFCPLSVVGCPLSLYCRRFLVIAGNPNPALWATFPHQGGSALTRIGSFNWRLATGVCRPKRVRQESEQSPGKSTLLWASPNRRFGGFAASV